MILSVSGVPNNIKCVLFCVSAFLLKAATGLQSNGKEEQRMTQRTE
jgi:hypothetical protein